MLIWVHGGAFVAGDLDLPESDAAARALAASGIDVVTVDYRRVARGPRLAGSAVRFPVPVDDVSAVIRQLRGQTTRAVIAGGASAGACLVAASTLQLVREDAPLPTALLFAYGFFHARLPRPSGALARSAGRRRLTHLPALIAASNRNYAGSRSALADPLAFPGGHAIAGCPPALFLDAERDVFRRSSETFAAELTSHGSFVQSHTLAGARHAFLNRPSTPDYDRAIELIGDWVRGTAEG